MLIEVPDHLAGEAITALRSIHSGLTIRFFSEVSSHPEYAGEQVDRKLVQDILAFAGTKQRADAWRALLGGAETCYLNSDGWRDHARRNAISALSRALRPLFPKDRSPIDSLATRKKIYVAREYVGTGYIPTELGRTVYTELQSSGLL